MQYKVLVKSEQETIEIAENLEAVKFPGMVICLKGDLGVGKTLFTKSFANALQVKEEVTSPTFNIIKEYDSGQLPLYHIDVYRLEGNVDNLGLDEYFKTKGITIIEWADMIEQELPNHRLDITISYVSENSRLLVVEPHGKKYEEACENAL